MPKNRHTESQIISIFREAESELTVADICHKHVITPVTIYRWKKDYAGMDVNQARELKHLRDENGKLKKKLAELVVEVDDLRFINGKKW